MTTRISRSTGPILAAGVLITAALAGGCRPSPSRDDIAALLRSSDAESVYNAGVNAFRAKRFEPARVLWRHAAELGSHEAQSNLGFLLYYGYGGARDSTLAAQYWRRAMTSNDAEAHRHVAQAIMDGDTRLGSLLDAYSHAIAANAIAGLPGQLSGDQVGRDAKRLLDSLSAHLTGSQVARATQLGLKWATPQGYP